MLLVQPVWVVLMVAFHVCFKIRLLGESFSTFRAGESVFVLVREMNNLVFLQSIFSPEPLSTKCTFVRSLSGVCHHMLPELVWPVVFLRALGAMEPCDSKVSIVDVRLQMGAAGEL